MFMARIEEEIHRIELEANDLLQARGIEWGDAMEKCSDAMLKAADTGDKHALILPDEYGCFMSVYFGAGLCRRHLENDPENPEIISLLSVAAEALATWRVLDIVDTCEVPKLIEKVSARVKSEFGRNGAFARLAADPKQTEKTLVRECWDEWQKQPENYRSKAAFARAMLDKCAHLESQKKIEDWCREWETGTLLAG